MGTIPPRTAAAPPPSRGIARHGGRRAADNPEPDPHETNDTSARPIQAAVETDITSTPGKCAKNTRFTLAKATAVSHERVPMPWAARPGRTTNRRPTTRQHTRPHWCGGCPRVRRAQAGEPGRRARGRWQGLARLRNDALNHTSAHQAPLVWRVPEGQGGLRDRPLRAKGSRVAISRAAGPSGARNTRGATSNTRQRVGRLPAPHPSTPVDQQAITPSPAPPRG